MAKPPFSYILLSQLASVLADAIGQRASRKDMRHSSRHMLLALTFVSSLQVFFFLGILQFALPVSISSALYDSDHGSTPLKCFEEIDNNGLAPTYCQHNTCVEIPCPAQGPFSMFKSIILHPLLLLNGLQNIAYYVCEVLLYHQPLGVVLIVIAALTSSFVVVPLEDAFGIVDKQVSASVMILGIVGTLLCVAERRFTERDGTIAQLWARFGARVKALCTCTPWIELDEEMSESGDSTAASVSTGIIADSHFEGYGGVSTSTSLSSSSQYHEDDDDEHSADSHAAGGSSTSSTAASHVAQAHDASDPEALRSRLMYLSPPAPAPTPLRTILGILLPFLGLAVTYSMWFVTQKVFNNQYRTNVFGYTSIDQVLSPFYMWPFLILIDGFPSCKKLLVKHDELDETIGQAIRITWQKLTTNKWRGFWTIFAYRLLANARAIAYFYLGVVYELNAVYVELTFVRIVLSWLASALICAFAPWFIGMTGNERRTVFAPHNIIPKVIGTGLVVAALVIS